MTASNAVKNTAGSHAVSDPPEKNPGVLEEARSLFNDYRELLQDHAELAVLESKRAGVSAIRLVVMAAGFAVILFGAWLMLNVTVVLFLAEQEFLTGSTASALVTAINLIIAFLFFRSMKSQRTRIGLPVTMRSVKATLSELKGEEKGNGG